MTLDQEIRRPVRIIPSDNAIFSNGKPITYALVTDRDILLASGLCEEIAKRFSTLHNANLDLSV